MKKLSGFLLVMIMATLLFFSTESISTSDPDLASIIATNTANAESDSNGCDDDLHDQCLIYGQTVIDCDPSAIWHTCSK